jgi:uncharacterized membrane protein YuzA (DUF378 family)
MWHLLVIFFVGYSSIFAMGFQSRAVNHGNYYLAAANSFIIAVMQSNVWGLIVHDQSWVATIVYGCSGMCAITSSMWVHHRFFMKKKL